MLITRKSPLSGEVNTRDIDVTEVALAAWQAGIVIQRAMPELSADDREFIMTGITPEEWARTFPEE
jgi:hypothetical protein